MPIYEYSCPKCGTFDVMQRMSDAPLEKHEACGEPVKKLMSAGAFAFKGSGFYITDYARGGSAGTKPEKKAEGCDAPKTGACAGCPSAGTKAA
jgi:putative FmdB family regulatory protein